MKRKNCRVMLLIGISVLCGMTVSFMIGPGVLAGPGDPPPPWDPEGCYNCVDELPECINWYECYEGHPECSEYQDETTLRVLMGGQYWNCQTCIIGCACVIDCPPR